MSTIGPATRWAATQEPGTRLRWKQLELAAYAEHPDVRDAITGRAGKKVHGIELVLRLGLWFAVSVVRVVVVLAPLVGTVTAGAGVRLHFEGANGPVSERLHESGFVFLVAALAQLAALIAALRGRRDHPLVRWWSRYSTITGGLTLVAVVLARDRVDDWALYAIPVFVTVAAAVVTLLLTSGVEPAPADRARAQARAARLTPAERDAVGADVDAALDDLLARGVISPAVREKVRGAPLGALTVAVNAPRKRKPVR